MQMHVFVFIGTNSFVPFLHLAPFDDNRADTKIKCQTSSRLFGFLFFYIWLPLKEFLSCMIQVSSQTDRGNDGCNTILGFFLSFLKTLCCRFPQGKPSATESSYPTLIHYKVHAGFHGTMTWTTGSLSQRNILTRKKISQTFIVLLTGFEPRVFGSRVRRSTNWATPSIVDRNRKQKEKRCMEAR